MSDDYSIIGLLTQVKSALAGTVVTPMSRAVLVPFPAVTLSASYSAGHNMGGLIEIATGLTPGSIARLNQIKFVVTSSNFTAGTAAVLSVSCFHTQPTASTFTDAATEVIHANDLPKLIRQLNASGAAFADPTKGPSTWLAAPQSAFTVGAAGKIWLAIATSGGFTATAPVFAGEVELLTQ